MTLAGSLLPHTTRPRARLPADGLVAAWDFGRVNLLKVTDDLASASWGKNTMLLDAGNTVQIQGGATLQFATNPTANIGSNSVNQTYGPWMQEGGTISVTVRDVDSGYVGIVLVDLTRPGTVLYYQFNFATQAFYVVLGAAATRMAGVENLGGGTYRLWVQFRDWVPGNVLRLHVGYVSTGKSVYLGGAQLNAGGLRPYEAQGDGQSWPDTLGRGLELMLGTTAGSEATDPTSLPAGLQFDGIDDRATRTPLTDSFAAGITLHALVTLSGVPGGAYHGLLASVTGAGFYPRLLVNSGAVVAQYASGVSHIAGSLSVPTDRPVGITATFDSATSKVYLNGALVAQAALNGNILSGPSPLYLGLGAPGSNTYWLGGVLHGAYIYNRALSAAETLSLHRASRRGLHIKGA